MTSFDFGSPAEVLAAEQAGVFAARTADVEAMERLLAWCDIHSVDPQSQPGAVPVIDGGDKLVQVGGAGTPEVAELCFEEFAIAAHAGVVATWNRAADLLDLRHRLPNTFAMVRGLRLPLWVARKVASMSRSLPADRVWLVDAAVAEAADEAPGRVLRIAEAKVIEADLDAYRAKVAADAARTGVWLRRKAPGGRVDALDGEPDVQAVGMRLTGAGAEGLVETIDALADRLATHYALNHDDTTNDRDPDADGSDGEAVPTRDQFRAQAAELLADPYAAVRLLDGELPTETATDCDPVVDLLTPPRRPAQLVVHLHADVLAGEVDGVARAEGIGPLLLEQVVALLNGREVTVTPVIDLNAGSAVNGYEHPTACKRRTILRTTRDVFPHSSRDSVNRLDHDHATPFDPGGPPGQTGDHNDAPLTRRDHRAKTHRRYRVTQIAPGAYRWETPHGLTRVVTGRGTVKVEPIRDIDGTVVGEIYDSPFRLVLAHGLGAGS